MAVGSCEGFYVLVLAPPAELLWEIDAMAKVIETLIEGGALAKAIAGELRTAVARIGAMTSRFDASPNECCQSPPLRALASVD